MLKKSLLLMTLPMATYATPIIHENNLILSMIERFPFDAMPIEFILAPESVVQDTYNQTFEPYSVYPMNTWMGVTSYYRQGSFYDGRTGEWYYTDAKITVTAPRKNNTHVANWAKNQQTAIMKGYNKGKVYATLAGLGLASAPEKLNFAFMGQLKIGEYVCNNIIIGQGHSGANNNWWIYSNFWPMKADGTPKKSGYKNRIECFSGDSRLEFRVKGTSLPNNFHLVSME